VTTSSIILALAGAVVGAFLGLLLNILLEDPASKVLARFLGPLFPRRQSLSGKWHLQDWPYDRPGYRKETRTKDVKLHQIGKYVRGKFRSQGKDYTISGEVRNNKFFVGTWSVNQSGIVWYGAFLYEILGSAEAMYGKWIGLDHGNRDIGHGEWEWKRPHMEEFPSEKPDYLLRREIIMTRDYAPQKEGSTTANPEVLGRMAPSRPLERTEI